jgi:hypothetical protein
MEDTAIMLFARLNNARNGNPSGSLHMQLKAANCSASMTQLAPISKRTRKVMDQ